MCVDLYNLKKNKLEEVQRLFWIPYLLFLSLFFPNSFPYSQNLNSVLKTYDTGEKWYEGSYKDGKVDGSYTFWYKNGQKSTERNYKNGKVEGLEYYWFESGQKYRELTYKNNELISEKEWNEDGSVKE
mgnify:CR=1 FL=1